MIGRLLQVIVGCSFIGVGVFAFLKISDAIGYDPGAIIMIVWGVALGIALTLINRVFWPTSRDD